MHLPCQALEPQKGEAETLDDSYHLENQEHNSYRLLHEEDDTNQDSYAWYQPTIHYVSGGPPNSFEDDRFTITARDNSVSPTEIDWRKRCVELEDSLRNFRDQAGSIRELLKNKVSAILLYLEPAVAVLHVTYVELAVL
ncbi:hypothetical protein QYM36_015344 [Artemia franciscana]|uniref:Uncharacterized protein n=1 Tax=Artemia franciscana TaxID=6661 RepID=A0AA88KZT4_ARTSF|nr:hypothetical protein QYM36_015344 [Artemia franciscana]